MAQGKQALLDRLPSAKQRLLDRLPRAAPATSAQPTGPVMAGGTSIQGLLGERQRDDEGGTLTQVGHGAIESFMRLPELAVRAQSVLPREAARLLARIVPSTKPAMEAFERNLPQPGMSHMAAQAVLPITEEEHGTVASTLGNVAGGLAQMPILGPAGIPGMAAGFGGQSYLGAYDEAKANGASELEAHKAGAIQGGISALTVAATAKLATLLHVNSGGAVTRVAKNVALGAGTGVTEQTASNWMTQYTKEKDREVITGLKGRAATDAAVGLLMSALFPGHKPSKRVAEAMGKVKPTEPLAPKVPEPIPDAAQLVGLEGTTAKQAEPPDPFLQKTQELQDTQSKLSALEAKNRGQKAPLEDLQERLRLIGETQRLALESQEIAGTMRAPEVPVEAAPVEPAPQPIGTKPKYVAPTSIGDKAKLRAETLDLQSFVRSVGGIRGDTPEGRLLYGGLSEKEVGTKFGLGPIVRSPKSTKGQNWEHIKEKAFEAGYFPGHERSADVTFQEFADALTENRKHPERAEFEAAREADAEQKYNEAAEAHYREQFPEEAAAWDAEKLAAEADQGDTSFDPSAWEPDLHAAVTEQTGDPKIADAEVAATKAAMAVVGEPPGPPKPPTPAAEIPAPMDPGGSSTDRIGLWIGEKQLAHANADRKGGLWRKALDRTLTGGFGRVVKERFGDRGKRARALIEEAGQLDMDLRGKIDEEYAKYGSKITDEQRAVLERIAALTPGQRAVIDEVIANNLELSKLAQDESVISAYYDVYTKRLWEGVPSEEAAAHQVPRGPAKFATFTTGALPRSYSSILEGWAKGNVLKVKSFVEATIHNEKVIADVIANRNLIEDGRKAGWLRTAPRDGDVQIEHPNFKDEVLRTKITAPESAEAFREQLSSGLGEDVSIDEAVKVYGRAKEGKGSIVLGRDMRILPRGNDILVMQKVPLYASKEDARIINNVLGRSAITKYIETGTRTAKAVGAVDKFSVIAKTMRTAMVQDNVVWIAMRNFLAAPAKTPADILTLAPYMRGQKMIESWGPDIQAGIRDGGLRLSPNADVAPWFELEKGRFSKALDRMQIVGPAKAFVENAYVDLNNFLYGKFIPAYKGHLYTLELARWRRANREKLLRGIVQDVEGVIAAATIANNVMAGQNWQRQGTSPLAMHGAQLLVFAPDRMTSTIRTATDAFKAGAVGQAHRVLWSRMMSRYIFAWAAFNIASAWMDDPEHPLENFKRRSREHYGVGLREFLGWDAEPILRAVGRNNPSRLFVNLTAQTNDPIDLVNDPLRYAGRKLGIVPRMAMSALAGEDYFGKRYTTLPELTGTDDKGVYQTTRIPHHVRGMEKGGKLAGQVSSYQSDANAGPIGFSQVPSFVAGNVPLPFELENWIEVVRGQTDAYDAILQSMGFRTMAPSLKRQEAAGIDAQGPTLNHGSEMRRRYLRAAELGAN